MMRRERIFWLVQIVAVLGILALAGSLLLLILEHYGQ